MRRLSFILSFSFPYFQLYMHIYNQTHLRIVHCKILFIYPLKYVFNLFDVTNMHKDLISKWFWYDVNIAKLWKNICDKKLQNLDIFVKKYRSCFSKIKYEIISRQSVKKELKRKTKMTLIQNLLFILTKSETLSSSTFVLSYFIIFSLFLLLKFLVDHQLHVIPFFRAL